RRGCPRARRWGSPSGCTPERAAGGRNRGRGVWSRGRRDLGQFAPRGKPPFWGRRGGRRGGWAQAPGDGRRGCGGVRGGQAGRREVLQRLEPLSEQDRMRWLDLLWFVLSWALRRRPGAERDRLLEAARSSQMDVVRPTS